MNGIIVHGFFSLDLQRPNTSPRLQDMKKIGFGFGNPVRFRNPDERKEKVLKVDASDCKHVVFF